MNAAIRAVVRMALGNGWETFGVRNGYRGLVDGADNITELGPRDVGGILGVGGTFLGSARLEGFKEPEIRAKGLANLRDRGIDGLVVIGGNGSQSGALALSQMGLDVVGVASTIDNDLAGSEITIGVDTALNIALEAIDRLRVTAASHRRAFLVEVMGRKCGYLALMAAIAGGADVVVVPEADISPETVVEELEDAYKRGKAHALVVVAEGAKYNAAGLAKHFEQSGGRAGFDLRMTTLGHVQRGGVPSAFDRLLATRLAVGAVERLARGEHGVLVGLQRGDVVSTPLRDIVGVRKEIDLELLDIQKVLVK
jgi:6-phosphofructokinase 1